MENISEVAAAIVRNNHVVVFLKDGRMFQFLDDHLEWIELTPAVPGTDAARLEQQSVTG